MEKTEKIRKNTDKKDEKYPLDLLVSDITLSFENYIKAIREDNWTLGNGYRSEVFKKMDDLEYFNKINETIKRLSKQTDK